MIRVDLRALTVPIIVLAVVAVTAPPADAIDAQPVPERVPRPHLAIEPWSGFWPLPGGQDPRFPLDTTAQREALACAAEVPC